VSKRKIVKGWFHLKQKKRFDSLFFFFARAVGYLKVERAKTRGNSGYSEFVHASIIYSPENNETNMTKHLMFCIWYI